MVDRHIIKWVGSGPDLGRKYSEPYLQSCSDGQRHLRAFAEAAYILNRVP